MTNLEIKQAIDKNNERIQFLLNPSEFTLNNAIAAILAENVTLQQKCTHNFLDGYCEYCYTEEGK